MAEATVVVLAFLGIALMVLGLVVDLAVDEDDACNET